MTVEALPPPLCVFCGAPWDEPMMRTEIDAGQYESSWPSVEWRMEIHCSACKRLVYVKEGTE